MKHITITLSPILLAGDDVDPTALALWLDSAIVQLNATPGPATIEAIAYSAPIEVVSARSGVCRIGGHTFYAPHHLSPDRPVPGICPGHSISDHDDQAQDFHRPLFEEVTRLTGLTPLIWDGGGGAMVIVIPVNTPEPGADWMPPCYLGLVEGHTDEGLWHGGVEFYTTDEQADPGDGINVFTAKVDDPRHPHAEPKARPPMPPTHPLSGGHREPRRATVGLLPGHRRPGPAGRTARSARSARSARRGCGAGPRNGPSTRAGLHRRSSRTPTDRGV